VNFKQQRAMPLNRTPMGESLLFWASPTSSSSIFSNPETGPKRQIWEMTAPNGNVTCREIPSAQEKWVKSSLAA
jgi:hypothetical protein